MIERGLIKTSGGYIHYRSAGQGKPLILLHTNMTSSTSFLDVMPLLAERLHVYAMDYPGYGDSDRPSHPYTIPEYAQSLGEFMSGLGLEKASILGEAMGRLVAMDLAAAHPERVERLIIQSPAYYTDDKHRERSLGEIKKAFPTNADGFPLPRTLKEATEVDTLRRPRNATAVWVERTNTDLAKAGLWFTKAADASRAYFSQIIPCLERIKCPTLLIIGEFFYYRQFADVYASHLKDARVAVIPGAQLSPQYDNPEELSRVIIDFVAGSHKGE